MRALDRKLFRSLWQIKGQALAISLVIAAGVTIFIMYLSTFKSLRLIQQTYYDNYRFADVFASLKRAPLSLAERIRQIPGVSQVQTRVVVDATLDLEGFSEPVVGRLISIPDQRQPMLNDLFIRRGRYLEPARPDEVLVSEGFALAHHLEPGHAVAALINGRYRKLRIVGIALSPEYVYSIRPGDLFPDDKRFGVLWMERKALASAFNMEGGFNQVSLKLRRDAAAPEIIARLDHLLEPYGGLGAIPRSLQTSNWYLDSELTGLQYAGKIVPAIFLAVSAFLLHMVLARIVTIEREQIAVLKAVGYSNFEIASHYLKWSLVIALTGAIIGIIGGARLGTAMTTLYKDYFRFPLLQYQLSPEIAVLAVGLSLLTAALGAFAAVYRAVSLPPAEAMRPEAPAKYRESLVERLGLKRFFSEPVRMVMRNLERHPLRALMSVTGIALGSAIMVVGTFFLDSIDLLLDVQFNVAQRQDVTVSFVEPASARAFYELERLPGVLRVERSRAVLARLRFGNKSRQVAITGLEPGSQLARVVDAGRGPVGLPPTGLVLSAKLAELLGVQRGDTVIVEVLEGSRPVRQAVVTDLVKEYMGTSAYMDLGALQRIMREEGSLSGGFLQVDQALVQDLYRRLKATPAVAGVSLRRAAIQSFRETIAQTFDFLIFFNILFSVIIAFGVVYNAARILLSERNRELATLRVMGFERGEVSFILLGELAMLVLIGIPLGLLLGYELAALIVRIYDTELYRFPLVISVRTYLFASTTVLVAAVISGLITRRKLDRLDLVAVLKARE